MLHNETLTDVNPLVEQMLAPHFPGGLPSTIARDGDLQNVDKVPAGLRELLRTVLKIPYQQHIMHLVTFQRYTDNAVSKTINLPTEATHEDITNAYWMAWQQGTKGITIYRSSSKKQQVLYKGVKQEKVNCRVCGG